MGTAFCAQVQQGHGLQRGQHSAFTCVSGALSSWFQIRNSPGQRQRLRGSDQRSVFVTTSLCPRPLYPEDSTSSGALSTAHELMKLRGEQATPASPRPTPQKPHWLWRCRPLRLQASLLRPTVLSDPPGCLTSDTERDFPKAAFTPRILEQTEAQ